MSVAYNPYIEPGTYSNYDYTSISYKIRLGNKYLAISPGASNFETVARHIEEEFERALMDERVMLQSGYAMGLIKSAHIEETNKLENKQKEEDKLKDLIAYYYSKG